MLINYSLIILSSFKDKCLNQYLKPVKITLLTLLSFSSIVFEIFKWCRYILLLVGVTGVSFPPWHITFRRKKLNGVSVPFQELLWPTSHSQTASCKYEFYNLVWPSQIRGTTELWNISQGSRGKERSRAFGGMGCCVPEKQQTSLPSFSSYASR